MHEKALVIRFPFEERLMAAFPECTAPDERGLQTPDGDAQPVGQPCHCPGALLQDGSHERRLQVSARRARGAMRCRLTCTDALPSAPTRLSLGIKVVRAQQGHGRRRSFVQKRVKVLALSCLNPALAFGLLESLTRSIVLTSGAHGEALWKRKSWQCQRCGQRRHMLSK